ncbi:apolipoprotein N-acyltransferase [Paraoerskovia marina]|uniref:apolipoprotein N-acyltransferase n=1 Tax=Paraoerskovia marina TaxID=545619 RepID=UPI0005B76DB6|nr:apolipoprotein N-acyltransferase [Paraoerskovia marina]
MEPGPRPDIAPPSRALSIYLAVAGGAALFLAFPDAGIWPLAPVGTTLAFLALRRDHAGWNALTGLVLGLTFLLPHLWWSYEATALLPWIALSVLQAAFFALFGATWTWTRRTPLVQRHLLLQALAFSVLWVAVEQFRSSWPFGGFAWARLGFSQAQSPLGHYAWLGSIPAVSLAVTLTGTLLAVTLITARRTHRTPALAGAGTAVVLVLGGLLVPLSTDAQSGTLAVGAVQGNVAEPGLGSFANRGEVLQNHVDGTFDLLDDVEPGELDIVLWPENGSDLDPQTTPDVAADIDEAAQAVDAPILVGAQEFPDTGGRYNVALLWEPGVGVTDRYAKQRPAPFGEYIPMRAFVGLFTDQVDRVTNDMIAGDGPAVVDLDVPDLGRTVPLATIICFEVAYDDTVQQSIRDGGELLVVPTNNASFGFTAESTQQLAMSQLRAIETGRSTVQISTVGVSGVIAADGTMLEQTDLFTADQMIADLPLRTTITPAVFLGAWPELIIWGVALILLGTGVVASRRRRA